MHASIVNLGPRPKLLRKKGRGVLRILEHPSTFWAYEFGYGNETTYKPDRPMKAEWKEHGLAV